MEGERGGEGCKMVVALTMHVHGVFFASMFASMSKSLPIPSLNFDGAGTRVEGYRGIEDEKEFD
jgi:hypothetical protein